MKIQTIILAIVSLTTTQAAAEISQCGHIEPIVALIYDDGNYHPGKCGGSPYWNNDYNLATPDYVTWYGNGEEALCNRMISVYADGSEDPASGLVSVAVRVDQTDDPILDTDTSSSGLFVTLPIWYELFGQGNDMNRSMGCWTIHDPVEPAKNRRLRL